MSCGLSGAACPWSTGPDPKEKLSPDVIVRNYLGENALSGWLLLCVHCLPPARHPCTQLTSSQPLNMHSLAL